MAKDTKLAIGPGSLNLACLVVTPTGGARFVRNSLQLPRDVINRLLQG